MRCVEVYQVLRLLPQARKHIIFIKQLLQHESYHKTIQHTYDNGSKRSLRVIAKSYFWACRSIVNCQCLPRSIALFQHLKASGYDVQHRFGVNRNDKQLAAHAWVEHQHMPLNESAELKQRFTVLD